MKHLINPLFQFLRRSRFGPGLKSAADHFYRGRGRLLLWSKGMLPRQMVGRKFNLERKRLVDLEGYGLYVSPEDYVGSSIIQSRSYEPHVAALLRKFLSPGDVFLDLGANVGFFTMLASYLVKNTGKVIAFEPNPQNLQLIYSSIQKNEMVNIEVYPYAVSDTKGLLRFTTVGSNGGVVTTHAQDQNYYLIVQSVILDVILKDEPRINLVKIDIEAHEPFALRGMVNLIKRLRPSLITEFHPWAMRLNNLGDPVDYLEQIFQLGYKLSIIKPSGDLLPVSTSSEVVSYWESLGEDTIQLDLFAQPSE